MSLAAGSKLGPYEIGAPLGGGRMGEVYRVRDPRLDIAPQLVNVSPGKSANRTSPVLGLHMDGFRVYQALAPLREAIAQGIRFRSLPVCGSLISHLSDQE